MKKILSMLLVMVMIFSLSVFATETTTTDQETNVETVETTSEVADTTTESEAVVEEEDEQIYFRAKVIEASEVGEKTYMMNYYGQEIEYPVTGQDLKLLVQDGKYKGVEISLVYPLGEQGATEHETKAKVGDKIYITVSENTAEDGSITYGGEIVLPINSAREIVVIVSIVVLLILVVLLSRLKSLKTIGVILLNAIILFVTFGILYLQAIPALAILAIAAVLIIITNTIIINNFSKKTLVAIIGIMIATIITTALCIGMVNITDVSETFEIGTYAEGEAVKPEYIDIIVGTIIIASVGVAINMAIKTVNEYMKGEGIMSTIKVISADLVKCLNAVLLVAAGTLLTNVFYIAFQNYPMHMILFGDDNAFVEVLKVIVIMANPIIVVPITAILSKLLLEPTKGIDEAK